MRSTAVMLLILLGVGTAHAEKERDPWYRGERGRKRILHMSITGAVGLVRIGLQTSTGTSIFGPTHCRWCDPPPFDRVIRNGVVWDDTALANTLSNIDTYAVAPIIGITLLVIADRDASWSRLIDDILPVAETVAVSQLLTQIIKFSVARRRPYAEFAPPGAPKKVDDNMSFISGHSSLGFAITASAGMICHWRHYWTEPYVWGTGIALSLTSEYLRMAADKHWMSDVVVGGLVGLGSGLLIPRLMRQDIVIAPVPGGAAVVGSF